MKGLEIIQLKIALFLSSKIEQGKLTFVYKVVYVCAISVVNNMATAAMATAAGAAALLYYTLRGRTTETISEGESSSSGPSLDLSRKRVRLGPAARAPSTWFEAIATLSETLRFTYAETFGKWPITDLAFGINFLMKRQGHLQAASIYAGDGSCELRGEDVVAELKELLILLTTCIHFSKKPFPLFLEACGYSRDCVLLQEPKAGLLKPAFTILVDEKLHSVLLLIRGTHSVKDTLTAVTGAVVPFHHTVLDEGGVSNLILGYAHCGMVAAARWIAQVAAPALLEAQSNHPTYNFKIVGHSLGGGTAALLTYILREREDFSSVSCICFAPAACMTWELAESGKTFITSVINGSDLVPTFSAASIDDLRTEVTASAWVSDFREQIERVQFLKAVLRSTSALSNRLSSIASASKPYYPYLGHAAKAGVANAWRPVSSGTQVVIERAQNVVQAVVRTRPSLGLAGWSCMGARRRTVSSSSLDDQQRAESPAIVNKDLTEDHLIPPFGVETQRSGMQECHADIDYHHGEDDVPDDDHELPLNESNDDTPELTEQYLWQQLEQELDRQRAACVIEREEEEKEAKKITKEEEENLAATTAEMGENCIVTEPDHGNTQGRELNRFFPPGRIVHMLSLNDEKSAEVAVESGDVSIVEERRMPLVGLYETDRALYGKVHLSRMMIHDHYMPNYKRVMELLIEDLEKEIDL